MLRNRNTLILGGAALAAFLAFLLLGDEGDRNAARDPGRPEATGALQGGASTGATGADFAGAGDPAEVSGGKKKKIGGKKKHKPDPELVKKLQPKGDQLVASGPPESSRPGIVQQNFTGSPVVGGRAGAGVRTAGGTDGDGAGNGPDGDNEGPGDDEVTCPNCQGPTVRTMVVDILKQPALSDALEKTCSSAFLTAGYGERFDIGGDPACAIFVPQTCRGSAVALFENRFFVTVSAQCAPSLQYLKDVLQR
ncbi:MAG: hypothetical protein Q8R92_20195 [Deltaproteobacteria bacterium]|nr:hypothetical protein [Deltaproteobacteria bacterium]